MRAFLRILLLSLVFGTVFQACASVKIKTKMAPKGELPTNLPQWEISESEYFPELKRTYGTGLSYERAKIKYLLGYTSSTTAYRFNRNGYIYDGKQTSKHLSKKYRRDVRQIQSAEQFIDNIATKSSLSGKAYLVLSGNGIAYSTARILKYELARLEAFMDNTALSQNRPTNG